MQVSAQMVKDLRERTGAGMMDCKAALTEAGGDLEKAIDVLRRKGLSAAAKKSGRVAADGLVHSYIHPGARIGVLVEINCETDFAAHTEDFQELAKDVAMHIAAADPAFVRREEVTAAALEREKAIYAEQAAATGKPAAVIEKIVAGKLEKYYAEVCLIEQPFVKNPDQTVGQMVQEKVAKIGENIQIRRFARFKLGEGIEKKSGDLAAEVAATLAGQG